MKLNWGNGIVLAFIGFISFIMYFIISVNIDKTYDYDLVTEDYYGEELIYQQAINKLKNAEELTENIRCEKTDKGLMIYFPRTMEYQQITGQVLLYRPSNIKLDYKTTLNLKAPFLLIPKTYIVGGRWDITVDWHYADTDYLFKESIHF